MAGRFPNYMGPRYSRTIPPNQNYTVVPPPYQGQGYRYVFPTPTQPNNQYPYPYPPPPYDYNPPGNYVTDFSHQANTYMQSASGSQMDQHQGYYIMQSQTHNIPGVPVQHNQFLPQGNQVQPGIPALPPPPPPQPATPVAPPHYTAAQPPPATPVAIQPPVPPVPPATPVAPQPQRPAATAATPVAPQPQPPAATAATPVAPQPQPPAATAATPVAPQPPATPVAPQPPPATPVAMQPPTPASTQVQPQEQGPTNRQEQENRQLQGRTSPPILFDDNDDFGFSLELNQNIDAVLDIPPESPDEKKLFEVARNARERQSDSGLSDEQVLNLPTSILTPNDLERRAAIKHRFRQKKYIAGLVKEKGEE